MNEKGTFRLCCHWSFLLKPRVVLSTASHFSSHSSSNLGCASISIEHEIAIFTLLYRAERVPRLSKKSSACQQETSRAQGSGSSTFIRARVQVEKCVCQ